MRASFLGTKSTSCVRAFRRHYIYSRKSANHLPPKKAGVEEGETIKPRRPRWGGDLLLVLYIIHKRLHLFLSLNLGIYEVERARQHLLRIELLSTPLILHNATEQIVVPNPRSAPHCSNLALSGVVRRFVSVLFALLLHARRKDSQCILPVAVLASAVGVGVHPGWNMGYANGGVPCVAVLSAGTLPPDGLEPEFGLGDW